MGFQQARLWSECETSTLQSSSKLLAKFLGIPYAPFRFLTLPLDSANLHTYRIRLHT